TPPFGNVHRPVLASRPSKSALPFVTMTATTTCGVSITGSPHRILLGLAEKFSQKFGQSSTRSVNSTKIMPLTTFGDSTHKRAVHADTRTPGHVLRHGTSDGACREQGGDHDLGLALGSTDDVKAGPCVCGPIIPPRFPISSEVDALGFVTTEGLPRRV